MSKALFVDTTAFVALNDPSDPHHGAAVDFVKILFGQTRKITTSSLVVDHAATEIRNRLGALKAEQFLDYFEQEGIVLLKHNDTIHLQAKQLFLQHPDERRLAFYDFLKAALMHYYHIHELFTFNAAFDTLNLIRVP